MCCGTCSSAGHDVTGIDVLPTRRSGAIQMDLRDPKLVEQIPEGATLIHLAAVSTDSLCKTNPLEAWTSISPARCDSPQAALEANCEQFVFASSEWVYGDVANDEMQRESSPIDVTRITVSLRVQQISGRADACLSGLPNVTILRFGIIYGPREKTGRRLRACWNQ